MKIDLGHTDARRAQISSTVLILHLKDSRVLVYGSIEIPPRKPVRFKKKVKVTKVLNHELPSDFSEDNSDKGVRLPCQLSTVYFHT